MCSYKIYELIYMQKAMAHSNGSFPQTSGFIFVVDFHPNALLPLYHLASAVQCLCLSTFVFQHIFQYTSCHSFRFRCGFFLGPSFSLVFYSVFLISRIMTIFAVHFPIVVFPIGV